MALEGWLDCGLDLVDAPDDALDLRARGEVEERDAGASARRVAGARHLGEIAVGDEAERHRVDGIDMAAEGAGEGYALGRGMGALDEQLGAGIERGLGELDRAHVGLIDGSRGAPSLRT